MKSLSVQRIFCFILAIVPLAVLPFTANYYELPKIVLFRSAILTALMFFGFNLIKVGKIKIPEAMQKKPVREILIGLLFLFVFLIMISVAPKLSFWGSYFRGQGIYMWLHYLLFFLLMTLCIHTKKDWDKLEKFAFAGLFATVVFGIIQYFFSDLREISLGRAVSTFGQPDYFAYYIILLVFPLISSFIREKNFWKGLLIILSLAAMIATESRGAFVGFFVGMMSYLIISGFVFKKKKLLICAVALAMTAGLTLYSHSDFLFTRSTETRLRIWNSSMEMLRERPLFGYGPETFPIIFQSFADSKILGLEQLSSIPDKAHNVLIELLSEGGVVFLAFFLFAFASIFVFGLKNIHGDKTVTIGILSSLMAAFAANQFGFAATTHFIIIVFLLAELVFYSSKRMILKTVNLGVFWKVPLVVFVFITIIFHNLFVLAADHEVTKGFGIENYLLATTLNPHQRDYNYILANIYNEYGDTEKAAYYIEKGGEFMNQADPYYYFLRGKILQSEIDFERAFTMAPTYPPLLLEWGKMEADRGNCDIAMEKFDAYLRLVPDSWQSFDEEKKRLFYKENPSFDQIFEYIKGCK